MLSRLDYLWRLLMTALAFSMFGLGGLLLSLTVFPLLYLLPAGKGLRRRVARRVIQRSFALFVGMMCVTRIMTLEVRGAERLSEAGGCLVLANHPTLIDVVVMISLMPSANCVVKSALWDSFFMGGVIRAARYIRNDDSETLVRDCARSLQRGDSLVIFPEGTRSVAGRPNKFLRGAARIALSSGADIVPVILDCTPSTLSKQEKWYQIPSRRFHFRLEVLPALPLAELVREPVADSVASRRLTEALQTFFGQRLALLQESSK